MAFHMKRSLASVFLLFFVGLASAKPTLAQRLDATKACSPTECTFREGRDLQITLSGLGEPNGGIVFEKSSFEGDYYASIGLAHGCVIVQNGKARKTDLTEVAFIHPRTAKVYESWKECKASGG